MNLSHEFISQNLLINSRISLYAQNYKTLITDFFRFLCVNPVVYEKLYIT